MWKFVVLSQTFKQLTHLAAIWFLAGLVSCTTTSRSETKPSPQTYSELSYGPKPTGVVSSPEPDDPFESINRPIFYFNDFIYRYSLIPLANGYDYIVPAGLDESFGNFFNNLREPLYAVNHLLQGEFRNFARNMTRFLVNTGLGFLGFFDTASPLLEIKKTPTTLSDTLAAYGVGQGPYLVLPILGSTTLRGTVTYPEDYFAHPARFYKDQKVATGLLIAEGVRKQIPQLLDYQDALEESQDPYRFVRNLYLQNLDRDESYEK